MKKCFLPMLLFCVATCLGGTKGVLVAQVPYLTQPALLTCAREGMSAPDADNGPLVYEKRRMSDTVPAPAAPATAKSYHYKTFKSADGTYGYDIFAGPKKLIHQATVPGQPGNRGFAQESGAAKVARLVVRKLQQNIFPPSVSTAELKELGVRY